MTTEAVTPAAPEVAPEPVVRLDARWWVHDCLLIAQRNVRQILRAPDLLISGAVLPLMFLFLFGYIFGGAMEMPRDDYTQFLLPGMLVMMITFASMPSMAAGMAEDLRNGIVNRFRSLPMTRSSVLVGRALSESLRNLVGTATLVIAGLIAGFRFGGGLGGAVAGIFLLLLFGFGLAWVAAYIGLSASSVQSAQTVATVWFAPVGFVSSVYVPTETLPAWLRIVADVNPVTFTVDAVRALFAGQPAGSDGWFALAWAVGLVVVFSPLAIRRFASRS